MITATLLKEVQAYMISQYPNEGCGFVVQGAWVPVKNISPAPAKNFIISNADTLKYSGVCTVFIHSHPDWYNCPTKIDMAQQQASNIPWGILSTNGTACSDIQYFGAMLPVPDLLTRHFCHGVTDCCTLINDWYKLNKGFSWLEVPRDWEWWDEKPKSGQAAPDLYTDNFARLGFKMIPLEDVMKKGPEVGDVFLARIRSDKLNHGGVYVGNGLGLHHLTSTKPVDLTRNPKKEPLVRWAKYIHAWARRVP